MAEITSREKWSGPVILNTAGDTFAQGARISGVIWEGGGTAGDKAELVDPVTGALLLPMTAFDSNIFQGLSGLSHGIAAPNGFKAGVLANGRLVVYIRED